ncbi:uncharacterized protein N7459_005933 [Penicillium hispanicum]|uniref:uncharacterized protein n=1 Tax=Penicillium hispanicum TaxID=1080232 RepID=UPI0025415544|nr:uncharacterized protein N7459_005933 [Penicillium hispanicum]KAJ5579948.1 hypothetical protein N7459_005933 [Penicillium hispanicum]
MVDSKSGTSPFITVGNLASLAKHIHQLAIDEFDECDYNVSSYDIDTKYSCTVGITFHTRIVADYSDAANFDAGRLRDNRQARQALI